MTNGGELGCLKRNWCRSTMGLRWLDGIQSPYYFFIFLPDRHHNDCFCHFSEMGRLLRPRNSIWHSVSSPKFPQILVFHSTFSMKLFIIASVME